MKHLLLVPVLLLAGCSSQQSYATKLNLPALAPPAVLASIESRDKDLESLFTSIENASTPAQMETLTSELQRGGGFLASLNGGITATDTPHLKKSKEQWQTEFNRVTAYSIQAAQIKKAQLEAGDIKDATGEVAQRLNHARQAYANVSLIQKSIP